MLIVLEGVDGSGKATHTELLYQHLLAAGRSVQRINCPNYESRSSSLVKMYLAGEFGFNPKEVNVYAASSFYAVDRFASYQKEWKEYLAQGDIILADRYVTSNMIHQACKLDGPERDRYLDWLTDYEYHLLGLPEPDLVVFLNMPPSVGQTLIQSRKNKITGGDEKDIHEKDSTHLHSAYEAALYSAQKYGWKVVDLAPNGAAESIEENSAKVCAVVDAYLNQTD